MYINNSSQIAAAYASYQTTSASLNISGSYLDITGGAGGSYLGSLEDEVDISATAQELIDRIKELDVFSIIYPNSDARKETKSLSEVEDDFLGDFNSFASAFGKLSALMGADGESFTMGLDGVGGVTVSGSNEGLAANVQNGFNQNSTAVSRFAVMAARAALADAGYTLDGFQDAYAEDPVAAIKDNIDALKDRLLGFRTVADGGTMQYGFVRDVDLEIDYSSTTASYGQVAVDAE